MVFGMKLEHQDEGTRGSFVLTDGEHRVGVLTYEHLSRDVVTADHTWVDESQRGRGVAGQLAAALVGWARAQHVRVVPACSYVAAWFARHPEHSDRIAET